MIVVSAEEQLGTAGVTHPAAWGPTSRSGPTAPGGTPTPTTTTPSTARSSATPTSSGARRACARPTRSCSATSPGRRVLEVGCGAAQCSRWLVAAGRRGRSALDLSAGMLRHAGARSTRRTGRRRCRWCRPTPPRCRSRDGVVRPGLLGLRRGAVRGRLGAGDARGRPGAAAGRPLGVLGHAPDALGLPRRPRPGRARGHAVLLRPHAVRRGRRRRRARPTSSTTARWATGCASSSRPGFG